MTMLRFLIHCVTDFTCWIKRNHMIKPRAMIVKVNIGSGLTVAEGWINIDASLNAFFSKWPRFVLDVLYNVSGAKQDYSRGKYCNILKNHVFVCHNVKHCIPFPEESVDYLYSSHLLEHLLKQDASKLLREAYRVLKKGGVIRICVPDLEHAIALYQKGKKEQALKYFFTTSKAGYFSRHQYMYDADLLKQLFKEAGFSDTEICSYRQGKTPDIVVLDNRPEETLYLEARK